MIRVVLAVGVAFLICGPAFADIVEVRGKGMMSGTIISQDEKEMTFKENDGHVTRFAKSDVLFFDRSAAPTTAAKTDQKTGVMGKFHNISANARHWFSNPRTWFVGLREWTDRATQKFRTVAGKPLNRSVADSKGQQLAKSLEEAKSSKAEMAMKQKKINAELRDARKAEKGGSEESKSGFSGTFGKL